MSLQDIRSECSDVAALLQPYVDAELSGDDHERVAHHLEHCGPCRTAVSEQLWVRAALRSAVRETAPAAVRARVIEGLDEVDREASSSNRGGRLRSFARGGLIMLPAAAAAGLLFVVARDGVDTERLRPTQFGAAMSALHRSPDETPRSTPAIRIEQLESLKPAKPSPSPAAGLAAAFRQRHIELVDAEPPESREDGARLRFWMSKGDRGQHIIARQRPAGSSRPTGKPVTFRGQRYLVVDSDDAGPVVHFERSGISHTVRFEDRPPHGQAESVADLLETAHLISE